mgnify:CR=1 FL=1
MQTSRFQLGLMAVLAVSLGFSLASSDAVGYPTGSVVSSGTNPAWNAAGRINGATSRVLVSAPSGQDAMVTDMVLSTNYGSAVLDLELSDGTVVAKYYLTDTDPMHINMNTGIQVPEGQSLSAKWTSSNYLYFSVQGYYAQP